MDEQDKPGLLLPNLLNTTYDFRYGTWVGYLRESKPVLWGWWREV